MSPSLLMATKAPAEIAPFAVAVNSTPPPPASSQAGAVPAPVDVST